MFRKLTVFLAAAMVVLPACLAGAGDSAPETISALIDGLRSDEAVRRDACEAALEARWDEAQPAMKAAFADEKDIEARARLERVLHHSGSTLWVATVKEALEKAAKYGAPFLIVRGDGPRETAATCEGEAVRVSMQDQECLKALRGYVAVWIAAENVPGLPAGATDDNWRLREGHGGVEMYISHPERGIVHYLRGYWRADRLAAEFEKGREFAAAKSAEDLPAIRTKSMEELKKAPGADSCESYFRHPPTPWNCNAEECTLKRLALCYEDGSTIIGADVSRKLPAPMEGQPDGDFDWSGRSSAEVKKH